MNKFFRINKFIDVKMVNEFRLFLEKINKKSNIEYVYLIFDTVGGETSAAAKIVNLMNKSNFKFVGVAYGKVSSAAIPIFLSTHIRYGYKSASALIHQARKTGFGVSDKKVKVVERQIFQFIAMKLSILLEDIYKMAIANDGKGTFLTMEHPLGKRFFIGN